MNNQSVMASELYSGTQDGNYSREGISRSFEAKLIQTNKVATSDPDDESAGHTNLEQHKY